MDFGIIIAKLCRVSSLTKCSVRRRGFSPHGLVSGLLLALTVLFVSCGAQASKANADPQLFGIYTATVDGKNFRLIIVDPSREMTHARVSPDGQWIAFTRYNRKGWGGTATQNGGYEETEIMIVRTDGTGLESVVPPKKRVVAANSSWTPDGKALIYISNDNPEKRARIHRIDLATRKTTVLPLPANLIVADPHLVQDKIVVSAFDEKGAKQMFLWMTEVDGRGGKQISSPPQLRDGKRMKPLPGDFDPRISPDGTKVVTMRHMGKDNWHIVVIDIATGLEKDLSREKAVDGVAEWSSDSRKIIFWHIDPVELRKSGIYTTKPDGADRQQVPLPKGFLYVHPSFFPGDGSGPNSRVIFSAKKEPLFR